MATNCTFKYYSSGPNGRGSELSAVISLADVTVNTTPTATGGWNTASVTADLQSRIAITPAQAVISGIPPGWYQKVGPTEFRREVIDA